MVENMLQKQVEQLGRRLRLGIVGGGEGSVIGSAHRLGARLDGRYDIVAGAFDIDPERGRWFARTLFVAPDRAYATYRDMIDGERARPDRVDLVSILTPNSTHFEITSAFVEAGFDVLCEKPLTTGTADAVTLARQVERRGTILAVMYGYAGYPMVRQARAMVASGEIGSIRLIESEFAPGNPATMRETAHWRTMPQVSGPSAVCCMLGTHALHLGTFITGLTAQEVAADLTTFVPGRKLDDNAHLMLRYSGGARGAMWLSYVAAGREQGLSIRIFGDRGGLEWHQEDPNRLIHLIPGRGRRIITRGSEENAPPIRESIRVAPGHPEGFIEAFATIYSDVADGLTARLTGGDPTAFGWPSVEDGVIGVLFTDAAVESSRQGGQWVRIGTSASEGGRPVNAG